jgi:hypothetical protein
LSKQFKITRGGNDYNSLEQVFVANGGKVKR